MTQPQHPDDEQFARILAWRNARDAQEPVLAAPPAKRSSLQFRPDIQGLRGIAVLLVVVNHLGTRVLTGGFVGVDVFFVLSGFLITSLLLKEVESSGTISLLGFYGRRAKRILPAAFLTLVCTDAAMALLANYVRAKQAVLDSVWAAFFAANIQFQRVGTDYFAQDLPPSPFQHFWSLAVEEQFYLLWPAVVLALILLASGSTRRFQVFASATLAVVIAGSLFFSAWDTVRLPADAYFSTFARAFELAIGASVAIFSGVIRVVPARILQTVGWLGGIGVIWSAIAFNSNTPFPGLSATIPVVSSALVLCSGINSPGTWSVSWVLRWRPIRFVGDVSYSFYLWHWPFLVVAGAFSLAPLTLLTKVLLIAAAFIVAVVTYFIYERPLHLATLIWAKVPTRELILWPASIIGVVVAALIVTETVGPQMTYATGGLPSPSAITSPSAIAITPVPEAGGGIVGIPPVAASVAAAERGDPIPVTLSPTPDKLASDFGGPLPYQDCIATSTTNNVSRICYLGAPRGGKTLVLFGDSHAQMWLAPLESIAKQYGWTIVPIIHDACSARQWGARDSPGCTTWFDWAIQTVKQLHPDEVLIGSNDPGKDADWSLGILIVIEDVSSGRPKIALLGDAPHEATLPTDCLLARGATMGTCTSPVDSNTVEMDGTAQKVVLGRNASFINVLPWFCSGYICPTVVGNTITHIDKNHVSETYALELQPYLDTALNLGG